MKKQISHVRISSVSYFSQIVKENHKKLLRFVTQLEGLQHELAKIKTGDKILELQHKISIQEKEITKTSFIIIIFFVITIDSYMYDYAARHLGDAFVQNHLDKLDTLSKCLVIPELVTGKSLNRSQTWYGLLKKTIVIRNKITHYKTKSSNVENIMNSQNSAQEVLAIALQSTSLLKALADTIIEIDPDEALWVKHNLS
jgi:hypothetical protein